MESRPANMPPTSLVDRLIDNSDRRQYGMGIVGRMTRCPFARFSSLASRIFYCRAKSTEGSRWPPWTLGV